MGDEFVLNGGDLAKRGARDIMLAPALSQIEDYWNSVRGARLVPARSEIDPTHLKAVLGYTFIAERSSTGRPKLRITGSHFAKIIGTEPRGLPLSGAFEFESRNTLIEACDAVFDEPAMVRLSVSVNNVSGLQTTAGTMVMLPLRSDMGDVTRLLGGIALDRVPRDVPCRLNVTGQWRKTLVGYADAPARLTPIPKTPRRASSRRTGHLKLVVDNT